MICITKAQLEVIKHISDQTVDVVIEHSMTPGYLIVTELLQHGLSIKYEVNDAGRKKQIA